jgi:hypothetical protein
MRFKTKLETQELNEAEELNQFIENLKNQELEFDFEKYVRQLSIVYDPSDRAKISDIIAIGISMGSGKEDRAQLDLLNKLLETKAILPTSFGGEYTVPGRKTSSEPQRLPIPTENESESESESESDSEPASLPNPEQGGLLTSAMVQLKKR